MDNLEDIGFYTLSNKRAQNASPNSRMQRCELIITDNCNFQCPYCSGCPEGAFPTKSKSMTLNDVKSCIDIWCKNEPLRAIRFSGGEPTLHKNILEMVEYAKKSGIERIAISTNGSNKPELYSKLIELGVNDFSISLDACDEETGDKMAGNIKGAWKKVVNNIAKIAKASYTTVGVVLTPDNISKFIEIIQFADTLGVSDIRVISAAHWNKPLSALNVIPKYLLDKYPILSYRVKNFLANKPIRGLKTGDSKKCHLMMDDSVICGDKHYPCVIYMREHGKPVGLISKDMREDRINWINNNNVLQDEICKNNCLDVCVAYNNKVESFRV